jgi:S1-C subfamily serine protease
MPIGIMILPIFLSFLMILFLENGNQLNVFGMSEAKSVNHQNNMTELFFRVKDSVVQIHTGDNIGSGFVSDKEGHIITNKHVIDSDISDSLQVIFSTGKIYSANIVGFDEFTDIAILSVEKSEKDHLFPLIMGDSNHLRIGDVVAVVGNPLDLGLSITSGVITDINGTLSKPSDIHGPKYAISGIIYTDAAIAKGSSGAPLLNSHGEVIGIITSASKLAKGLALAISSETFGKVVSKLIKNQSTEYPWIGISGIDVNPMITNISELKGPRGFLVFDVVNNSPAYKARINEGNKLVFFKENDIQMDNTTLTVNARDIKLGGDLIVKIDNKVITGFSDLVGYIHHNKEVGEKITLTVLREGQIREIDILLDSRPSPTQTPCGMIFYAKCI